MNKFKTLEAALILICVMGCSPIPDSAETEVSSGIVVNKELGFEQNAPDPGLYVVGISHLNVIVEDLEYATEFYGRTLGFVQAHNERGVMDY